MPDLKNPRVIKLKGFLFLFFGIFSAFLLVADTHSWRHGLLLLITVWSFCRFYYFAFYVIEHYVDPNFRFAGLWDFARYMMGKRRRQ